MQAEKITYKNTYSIRSYNLVDAVITFLRITDAETRLKLTNVQLMLHQHQ